VVSFRHDAPGTPEELWQAWSGLHALPRLPAPGAAGSPTALTVVAAHPDDETLGAGGLLALAAQAGIPVNVVVATNGDASHPRSRTTSPARLAERRAHEVREAVRLLAPAADIVQLRLPDGALAPGDPVLVHRLAERVVPGSWVAAPWRGDAHPDHAAAGDAAARVARDAGAMLLEYPVWAWHWGLPGDIRLPWAAACRLDLPEAVRGRKALAGRQHRSQTRPLSPSPGDEVLLAPPFLAHFDRAFEVFFATPPHQTRTSLPGPWFERFYAGAGEDPWGFEERWYEQRKRAVTLAALPRRRFRRAFEPGCSIGLLTLELAARCDEVVATDVAEVAVAAARSRLGGRIGTTVDVGRIPQDWPPGEFDLVVLSEVGYYCDLADLHRIVDATLAGLAADGVVVACHWRHPVPDHPLSSDVVHGVLADDPRLGRLARHEEEDFLLDVYVRPPVSSVARAAGLV